MLTAIDTITQAQAGDSAAFASLIREYRQRIFGTIYRLTGRPQDVEDIGQEVFLRLFASIANLRSPEVFDTWLYRLTVNAVYDHLRKRRRAHDIPMADLSDEQLRLADAEAGSKKQAISTRQAEAHELLAKMLSGISGEDRLLLERKEIEGLSLKELKSLYQVNENALKVRLFRARKRACEVHERLVEQAA